MGADFPMILHESTLFSRVCKPTSLEIVPCQVAVKASVHQTPWYVPWFVAPQGRLGGDGRVKSLPMRIVIFGHQFGAFPDPAYLMEPAAHGFCGHRDPMLGLERYGECGTVPPGAAPAIGTWSFFEEGAERAREPGYQDGGLDRDGELPVWINPDAEAPGAIRPYDPVHAGA